MNTVSNTPSGQAIIGSNVTLRPITSSDHAVIFNWRNDPESLYLWHQSRRLLSRSEFSVWMESSLSREIDVWLMAMSTDTQEPLGFVYNYDTNPFDAFSFICVYIAPGSRGRNIGKEAGALYLRYLMNYFPFRKIYADVFEFNKVSTTFVTDYGFVQEGYFPGHRYYQGQYWGMFRLALYRERWPEIEQGVFSMAAH